MHQFGSLNQLRFFAINLLNEEAFLQKRPKKCFVDIEQSHAEVLFQLQSNFIENILLQGCSAVTLLHIHICRTLFLWEQHWETASIQVFQVFWSFISVIVVVESSVPFQQINISCHFPVSINSSICWPNNMVLDASSSMCLLQSPASLHLLSFFFCNNFGRLPYNLSLVLCSFQLMYTQRHC